MKAIYPVVLSALFSFSLPVVADSAVNSQITDAITQSNTKVVGEAPAMGMGQLYQQSLENLTISSSPLIVSCSTAVMTYGNIVLHNDLDLQCNHGNIIFNNIAIDGVSKIQIFKPASNIMIRSIEALPTGFSDTIQFCSHDENMPSTVYIQDPRNMHILKSQPSDEGSC